MMVIPTNRYVLPRESLAKRLTKRLNPAAARRISERLLLPIVQATTSKLYMTFCLAD